MDVRSRLRSRLAGINETLARGRQKAVVRRPRNPARVSVSTAASSETSEKENFLRTPIDTPPGTPSRRTVKELKHECCELGDQVQRAHADASRDVGKLRDAFVGLKQQASTMTDDTLESERRYASSVVVLQDWWHDQLREVAEARVRGVSAREFALSSIFAELQAELRGTDQISPDVAQYASQLNEIRDALEVGRLQRCAATDSVGQLVDNRLQKLREAVEQEREALVAVRESVTCRFSEYTGELQRYLEEERRHRQERHGALVQVVDRFRVSLETTDAEI